MTIFHTLNFMSCLLSYRVGTSPLVRFNHAISPFRITIKGNCWNALEKVIFGSYMFESIVQIRAMDSSYSVISNTVLAISFTLSSDICVLRQNSQIFSLTNHVNSTICYFPCRLYSCRSRWPRWSQRCIGHRRPRIHRKLRIHRTPHLPTHLVYR